MNDAGNYAISWTRDDNVYVRRFNTNDIPLGKEVRANDFTPGDQEYSDIAIANDGSVIVTWESDEDQDGNYEGVFAKRFRADGTPDGAEFLVNTFTNDDQNTPAIAMNQNNNFVIAWESDEQDGNKSGIFAQKFEIESLVEFSQVFYQVGEDGTPAGLAVVLERTDAHLASQVQVTVTRGTATPGVDYQINSPFTVTFNPGEVQKTLTIPILQDNLIEGIEDLFLSVTGVSRAQAGDQNTATLRIIDDDNFGGGPNTPILRGTNRKDRLTGTKADETLIGMGKNDTIRAKGGDDILIGVSPNNRRPGKNERDKLMGNGGNDLYVLGNEDSVFYDDGRRRSAGLRDYALIKGFNKRQDTIQLHGDKSDYVLGSAPRGKGVGLFLEGREDELIAVIRGKTENLRLNSNVFEFV
ncbi:MAG: Calx-beta domain-containing protein [Cyanobacteria bacterium P01_E01_bin.6]